MARSLTRSAARSRRSLWDSPTGQGAYRGAYGRRNMTVKGGNGHV